jgi:hypothetical protein
MYNYSKKTTNLLQSRTSSAVLKNTLLQYIVIIFLFFVPFYVFLSTNFAQADNVIFMLDEPNDRLFVNGTEVTGQDVRVLDITPGIHELMIISKSSFPKQFSIFGDKTFAPSETGNIIARGSIDTSNTSEIEIISKLINNCIYSDKFEHTYSGFDNLKNSSSELFSYPLPNNYVSAWKLPCSNIQFEYLLKDIDTDFAGYIEDVDFDVNSQCGIYNSKVSEHKKPQYITPHFYPSIEIPERRIIEIDMYVGQHGVRFQSICVSKQ